VKKWLKIVACAQDPGDKEGTESDDYSEDSTPDSAPVTHAEGS
jgi:hypothetical protein